MSTIRADSVAPSAGGTSRSLPRGVAAAWANLNGTGTIAIRDSQNVSSFTDNAAGDYTQNATNALSNGNYAGVIEASVGAASTTTVAQIATNGSFAVVAPTASAFRSLITSRGAATNTDVEHLHSVLFGSLA
jgi:hypothetical protein